MTNSTYIYKHGKQLRTGYTTGSCAAAAAKAAVWMLKHQEKCQQVTIDTPKGWQLTLDVDQQTYTSEEASCCVIKDSGDDPDITNGIAVYAKVRLQSSEEVMIVGGEGIGRVTQKGLQVPVGQWAINPVPRAMIETEVRKVYPSQGLWVQIEVPEGVMLAKKTFNPRLGIEGGLSILGTTGIVEPMSEEALKDTIVIDLKVLREKNKTRVVLVPGSIGEKKVHHYFGLQTEECIKISNYLGFALDRCVDLGFEQVFVGGHLGKLIKPAGGTFYTHNRVSATRMEILTANLALLGMPHSDLKKIMACRTTEEAMTLIEVTGFEPVYQMLADKAADNCRAYCFDQVAVEVALFSMTTLLAKSQGFERMITDGAH